MADKKKSPKTQTFLSDEDKSELLEYLKVRGNKANLAEELGVSPQTVSNWMEAGKFPKYCLPFLKNKRILANLSKIKT